MPGDEGGFKGSLQRYKKSSSAVISSFQCGLERSIKVTCDNLCSRPLIQSLLRS